jgi:DNA-3-methyladenine glycosylase
VSTPPDPAALLAAPVLEVAPALLGRVVEHRSPEGTVAVRLTEVEAYAGEADPGSHAYGGRTPRTEVMFGPAGRLYVYFSYGMHWCVNLVCGTTGAASAVLLRAGEVVEGVELARSRRPAARVDRDLARGPARLAQALGIDGSLDGALLGGPTSDQPVRLLGLDGTVDGTVDGDGTAGRLRSGPRVGVSGAGGDGELFPWRFWLDGERSVSAYRPAAPRRHRAGLTTHAGDRRPRRRRDSA